MGLFSKKTKEKPVQVKTFTAMTRKGLDKQVNKFGKSHEILDSSIAKDTLGYVSTVRYK